MAVSKEKDTEKKKTTKKVKDVVVESTSESMVLEKVVKPEVKNVEAGMKSTIEKKVVTSKVKQKKKPASSIVAIKVPKESSKHYGTGKRKTSIARVWLVTGSGNVEINKKDGLNYLSSPRLVKLTQQPLSFLSLSEKYDIVARVKGGGFSGQASAINAGVAKALITIDISLHKQLKDAGFLTRDARIKERKHYGHKRARKSFQFSKR